MYINISERQKIYIPVKSDISAILYQVRSKDRGKGLHLPITSLT